MSNFTVSHQKYQKAVPKAIKPLSDLPNRPKSSSESPFRPNQQHFPSLKNAFKDKREKPAFLRNKTQIRKGTEF